LTTCQKYCEEERKEVIHQGNDINDATVENHGLVGWWRCDASSLVEPAVSSEARHAKSVACQELFDAFIFTRSTYNVPSSLFTHPIIDRHDASTLASDTALRRS
jgi:hypothetical protein